RAARNAPNRCVIRRAGHPLKHDGIAPPAPASWPRMRRPSCATSESRNRFAGPGVRGAMRRVTAVLAVTLIVTGCQLLPFLGGSAGTPAPTATTPEQAAQLVLARDARFSGLARRDPNLIGQGSWWDAAATAAGY